MSREIGPGLARYLELEREMRALDDADDPRAGEVRDALDPIWHALTNEERTLLNERAISDDDPPAPRGATEGEASAEAAERYHALTVELLEERSRTKSGALSDAEEARFAGELDLLWHQMSVEEQETAETTLYDRGDSSTKS